jgi:hypothetical protein
VTGRAGDATLTFIVNVVKIGEGPVQNVVPNVPPNTRLQPTARPHSERAAAEPRALDGQN